jgi:transcriptional regulator with XRE-family HTH domain
VAERPVVVAGATTPRRPLRGALGEFIRNQREITRLSLRQLANLARISNPYLSQIERGLHEPSAAILKSIAAGLGIAPEKLYAAAGWLGDENEENNEIDEIDVETAIRTDQRLTPRQKEALLEVYRGFLRGGNE